MHANIEIALQQQRLIEAGAAAALWERDELEAEAAAKRRPSPLQRRRGLTEQQVADQLGISLWTVKRERKRGRLGHVPDRSAPGPDPARTARGVPRRDHHGRPPMPKPPTERPDAIAGHWLSTRGNSPVWCATWFDPATRQTRRASLGETDFRAARLALAQFALARAEPRRARPEDTPLDEILLRYWEQHARHQPSAEPARRGLRFWSDAEVFDLLHPVAFTAAVVKIAALGDDAVERRSGLREPLFGLFKPWRGW